MRIFIQSTGKGGISAMVIADLIFQILTLIAIVFVWWDIKNIEFKELSPPQEKPKKPKKKKAYPNFQKHTPKVITDEMAWKLEREEKDGVGW